MTDILAIHSEYKKRIPPDTGFLPAKNREMPSIPNWLNVSFIFELKDTGRSYCITHSVSTVLTRYHNWALLHLKIKEQICPKLGLPNTP